jgi:hypothetical protein
MKRLKKSQISRKKQLLIHPKSISQPFLAQVISPIADCLETEITLSVDVFRKGNK